MFLCFEEPYSGLQWVRISALTGIAAGGDPLVDAPSAPDVVLKSVNI